MLKIADMYDFAVVKEMALEFLNNTEYKEFASIEAIEKLLEELLSPPQHQRIVLLHEHGFLAGMTVPFAFNPNVLIATELAWWVNPEHRKNGVGDQLLEAFEYWAKEKAGAQFVQMVSLSDGLGKHYEGKGYKLVERAYMKGI